jgi:hypothetical protein
MLWSSRVWSSAEQYAPRDFCSRRTGHSSPVQSCLPCTARGRGTNEETFGAGSLIPGLEDVEEENMMDTRQWEMEKCKALTQGQDIARSRGCREITIGQ